MDPLCCGCRVARLGSWRRPSFSANLSTPFNKYDHVCGEGFSAQTRRERRAYPFPTRRDKARATTSGPKRTAARRVASLFGSGVVAPRSSRQVGTGDAPSSRLARTEKRRNKRGRIYEMGYLAAAARTRLRPSRQRLGVRRSSAALNSWTGRRKASYRTNSLLGLDGI